MLKLTDLVKLSNREQVRTQILRANKTSMIDCKLIVGLQVTDLNASSGIQHVKIISPVYFQNLLCFAMTYISSESNVYKSNYSFKPVNAQKGK